jgi:hypothetical protein
VGHCIGVVILVLLSCPAISRGQSPPAIVNGGVRDTFAAAIPGVTVLVINDATGSRSTAKMNAAGIYSIPNLPPGTYRILISKTGFKTVARRYIVLHVQGAEAFELILHVESTSDPATAEGSSALMNTTSPPVSMLPESSIRGGWLSTFRRFVFDFSEAVPLVMLLLLEVWAFLLFLSKLFKLLKKPKVTGSAAGSSALGS